MHVKKTKEEPFEIMRQRPGVSSSWWLASVIFHALLIGWLIFFSPVRVIDLAAKKALASVSTARAREIVKDIEVRQEAVLSESIKALRQIQTKLAELETHKREEFKKYAQQVSRQDPAQDMEAILAAQSNSLAALQDGNTNASLAVKTRANVYFDALSDAEKLARDSQETITQAQDRVIELLTMRDDRFAPAINAQKEAIQLQDRAAKALEAADDARDPARSSRPRSALENQIDHYTYEVRRAQHELAGIPTNLVILTNQLLQADSALKAAQTAASQEIPERQKALLAAQRKLDSERKNLENARQRLPEYSAKAKELLAEPDPSPSLPTPKDSRLIELQAGAVELQIQARQAQAVARVALVSLRSQPDNIDPGKAALADLDKAAAPQNLPAQIQSTNLADLYDNAVKLESSFTESYRRLRAIQLSMIRNISLARALELTDVVKVDRPDLRAALDAPIHSGADVVSARDAVQTARSEISAMVQLGGSLLDQAQSLDQDPTVTADDLANQSALLRQMEADAQDNGEGAKDLTGQGKAGQGSEGGFNSFPSGGGSGAPGGFGPPGGPGGPGTGGLGDGLGLAMTAYAAKGGPLPVWPGRRIAAQGPSPKWLFVDSWYIIGPFDNVRRASINRQFPPETVIDLNAVYPGKNNIPIRWEFYQAGRPNIMPPLTGYNAAYNKDPVLTPDSNYKRNLEYIIYYAYTELWFEKPCDLWVALGSDDFSKVWVEDQLIWISGKQLKAWRVDEGYRKVHFKAGINRVLCRVENGNSRTEFSFVVCLDSGNSPPTPAPAK